MCTKIRVWFILVGVIIGLCAAYFFGYGRGHSAAVRDDTKFGILSYVGLYRLAEAGDTNRLQGKLGFLVFATSDYYDRNFSNEVVPDKLFLNYLQQARAIASVQRTQLVYFGPDQGQLNAAPASSTNK